jgi:adhesin/invasin
VLAGQTVNWTTDNGVLGAPSSTTNAAGQATVSLTNTVMGVAQVTGQVGAGAPVNAPVVTFTADSRSAQVVALSVDRTDMIADGVDAVTYTSVVTDQYGNRVEGAIVSWKSGRGDLAAETSTTDASGQAMMAMTTMRHGFVITLAEVNSGPGTGEVSIDVFARGDLLTAHLEADAISVDKTSVIGDRTDKATYSAVVTDANGATLSGVTVTWSTDLGTLEAASTDSDINGIATVTLTSDLLGTARVTGRVSATPPANAPEVTFVADAGSARIEVGAITADRTTAIASGADPVSYIATVTDATGNVLAGQTVNWTTDSGTLAAPSSTTNAAGQATVSLTNTVMGVAQVTGQVGAGAPVNAPGVTFTADSSAARIFQITKDKTDLVASGIDEATITVTIADASGNVMEGVPVQWTKTPLSVGDLSDTSSVTDSAGQAVTRVSSTKAGASYISARLDSGSDRTPGLITFTADSSTARLASVAVDKTAMINDGVDAVTYTATVQDARGNAIVGATVAWKTDLGDLAASASTTDNRGQATMTLTTTQTGTIHVAARFDATTWVNADPVTAGSTYSIDTVENYASQLIALDAANVSDPSFILVRVVDINGAPVVGHTVRFSTASPIVSLDRTTAVTDSIGRAYISVSPVGIGADGVADIAIDAGSAGSTVAEVKVVGKAYVTTSDCAIGQRLDIGVASCWSFVEDSWGRRIERAGIKATLSADPSYLRFNPSGSTTLTFTSDNRGSIRVLANLASYTPHRTDRVMAAISFEGKPVIQFSVSRRN